MTVEDPQDPTWIGYFEPPPPGFKFDPATDDLEGQMFEFTIGSSDIAGLDEGKKSPLRWWGVNLYLVDEDEARHRIARATIQQYRFAWTDGERFLETMSEESADLEAVAWAVTSGGVFREALAFSGYLWTDLLVVEDVFVAADYRGRRLSVKLVDWAVEHLSVPALVVLLPVPLEGERSRAAISGLARHWRRAGFKRLSTGLYGRYDNE